MESIATHNVRCPPATGLNYRFYQTPQSSPSPGPQPSLSLRRAKRAKRSRRGKKRRASEVEGLEESTRGTHRRPCCLEDTKAMETPHVILPAPSNPQVEVWASNVRAGPPPPHSRDIDWRGPLGSSLFSEFMQQRFAPRVLQPYFISVYKHWQTTFTNTLSSFSLFHLAVMSTFAKLTKIISPIDSTLQGFKQRFNIINMRWIW